MENARIIKLGNNSSVTGVATFEEAFGEFSEARGRGRQRRADRKADRREKKSEKKADKIEKRKERRVARVSARDEVKSTRSELRQGRRADKISARGERRGMRGELKDEALERRYGRKDFRASKKAEKEAMGREDEPLEDELQEETTTQQQDQYENDEPRESENEGIGEGEGEYETGGGGSYQEEGGGSSQEQGGGYQEEGDYQGEGEGEYQSEGGGSYQEEGDSSQEEEYDEEESDEEYAFDGVMGAEDRFSELADASDIKVPTKIQDKATKIEWNKELLSRLRVAKAKAFGVNNYNDADSLQEQINSTTDRINDLELELSRYMNFEGEFLNADGKKPSENFKKGRFKKVMKAKKNAYGKRMAIKSNRPIQSKQKATSVQARLNPEFGNRRIVIPASENSSNFTGIRGLDDANDFDAPPVREIKLGVDGSKTTEINWKGIAIGVGVGLVGIWAIRKYKLI